MKKNKKNILKNKIENINEVLDLLNNGKKRELKEQEEYVQVQIEKQKEKMFLITKFVKNLISLAKLLNSIDTTLEPANKFIKNMLINIDLDKYKFEKDIYVELNERLIAFKESFEKFEGNLNEASFNIQSLLEFLKRVKDNFGSNIYDEF